jgi:hypothetical protein
MKTVLRSMAMRLACHQFVFSWRLVSTWSGTHTTYRTLKCPAEVSKLLGSEILGRDRQPLPTFSGTAVNWCTIPDTSPKHNFVVTVDTYSYVLPGMGAGTADAMNTALT